MKSKPMLRKPSCTQAEAALLTDQPVLVGDVVLGNIVPRKFATGSYGWSFVGGVSIPLANGIEANCQCVVCIVVKHSGARLQVEGQGS